MKTKNKIFCLLLVLMLVIGTASAQVPGSMELNEELASMDFTCTTESATSGDGSILLVRFGYTASYDDNIAGMLGNAGYSVTQLINPPDGTITSTINSNNFEQVWLYDMDNSLNLGNTDANSIANWYNTNAKGNIIIDARSFAAHYTGPNYIGADTPWIENEAHAFAVRGGGLWIGTDHALQFTYNGNKLLETIGYETVTGMQDIPLPPPGATGDTSSELLTSPNIIDPSSLYVYSSPGIAPVGVQFDGVELKAVLWNILDGEVLTSYSLTDSAGDTTPPVITSPPDRTLLTGSEDYISWTITELNPLWYRITRNGEEVAAHLYNDGDTVNFPVDTTTRGVWIYNIVAYDDSINVAWDVVIVTIEQKVNFDIKPGSCSNLVIANSKGVLPVTILGTENFDVNDIDVSTITISANDKSIEPLDWYAYEDIATPYECQEFEWDGYTDLIFKFNTQEMISTLGLIGQLEDISLTVSGVLNDGIAFEGTDFILLKQKGK